MQEYYFLSEEDFYERIRKEQFFQNNGLIPNEKSIYGLFYTILTGINYPDPLIEYGKIFCYIKERQDLTQVVKNDLDVVDYCVLLLDSEKVKGVMDEKIISTIIDCAKSKIEKNFKNN